MRPDGVVGSSPVFDNEACLLDRIEEFPVEQLVAEACIKVFAIAIFQGEHGKTSLLHQSYSER